MYVMIMDLKMKITYLAAATLRKNKWNKILIFFCTLAHCAMHLKSKKMWCDASSYVIFHYEHDFFHWFHGKYSRSSVDNMEIENTFKLISVPLQKYLRFRFRFLFFFFSYKNSKYISTPILFLSYIFHFFIWFFKSM